MCFCNFLRFSDPERYKTGIQILSSLVLLAETIRIIVISFEIKGVYKDYHESYTLIFCVLSIILGILSLGLEALLLYSVKKRSLHGIQPWFMSTFLIFLIAMIACVVTFSIYVVNPIDHNARVANVIRKNNGTAPTHTTHSANTTLNLFNSSTTISLRIEEDHWIIDRIELKSTEAVMAKNGSRIGTRPTVWHVERPGSHETGHASKPFSLTEFRVRETLSLSFLIDVIRALPQLWLVNRFVKTERLHLIHAHSHQSLSALYVKHV